MSTTATFASIFFTGLATLPIGATIGAFGVSKYDEGAAEAARKEGYNKGFEEGVTRQPEPDKKTETKGQALFTMTDMKRREKSAYQDGWEEAEQELQASIEAQVAVKAEEILVKGFTWGVEYAQTGDLPDDMKQIGL